MTAPEDPAPIAIAPHDLAAWRAAGTPHALLDVREPWEVALCGFARAIARPLGDLLGGNAAALADLPRDRPLVVVCHHGRRSLAATLHLRRRGLANAVNLTGGVDARAAEIDPAMPRYRCRATERGSAGTGGGFSMFS